MTRDDENRKENLKKLSRNQAAVFIWRNRLARQCQQPGWALLRKAVEKRLLLGVVTS